MESVTCLRWRSATPPVLMHQDRRVTPPSILYGPTPSRPVLCGLPTIRVLGNSGHKKRGPGYDTPGPLINAFSQPSLSRIADISSRSYARSVVVRTVPIVPSSSRKAVALSSSGASAIATMS